MRIAIGLAWLIFASPSAQSQSNSTVEVSGCPIPDLHGGSATQQDDDAVVIVSAALQEIRGASFPELAHNKLRVRAFRSQSDYFRTRFSVSRFLLLMPMRYFVDVNPALLLRQAPSDGTCAILAHELVHVLSLSRGNRIRRLGLIRFISERYTAKFERGADLEAIHRGYGDGLKVYRAWVYTHIPQNKLPQKLRNYFSPEEITSIQTKMRDRPDLYEYWTRHVPTSLQEIERRR